MRREIPQKVDAQFSPTEQNRSDSAAQFGATLFRRTRSASLLSVTLSASTLGAMLPQQKVEAFTPSNLLGAAALPELVNSASFQTSAVPGLLTQTNQQSNNALAPSQAKVWQSRDGSNQLEPIFSTDRQVRSALELAGKETESIIPDIALSVEQPSYPSLAVSASDDSSSLLQNELTKVLEADVPQASIPTPENVESGRPTALIHKVQKGENLSQIAEKYKVSPESIAQSNKIPNPNVIEANQDLVVPSASISAAAAPLILGSWAGNTRVLSQAISQMGIASALLTPQQSLKAEQAAGNIQPISQPQPITAKLLTSEKAPQAYWQEPKSTSGRLALNMRPDGVTNSYGSGTTSSVIARRSAFPQLPALELPSLSSAEQFLPSSMQGGSQKYIWPAKGVFTSAYGWRWGRMHRGIDVAGPVGTPIVAAAAGVVVKAGWDEGGYGNLVEIQHPDGSLTRYAHNSSISTRIGAAVQQGELIAAMGSTGRSTGPHCHFEIRANGRSAVDPMIFLSRS